MYTGDGFFDLNLVADDYTVYVEPFTSGYRSGWVGNDGKLTEEESNAKVFSVVDGTSVDAGVITLQSPVRVSGIVKNEIGQVLSGAQVELFNNTGYYEEVYSNSAGEFVFTNVPADDYTLAASHDANESISETLTVGATNLDHDVVLPRAGSISGTVTSAAGKPLRYVDVRAEDDDGNTGSAVTNAQGKYSITGLSAGTYKLNFYDDLNEYGSSARSGVAVATSQQVIGQNVSLSLLAPDPQDSPVDLSGVLASTSGAPLAGGSVSVRKAATGASVTSTRVNRAGQYAFRYLATGNYTFQFEGPDADPDANELPYEQAYYPGTGALSKATVVAVTADVNKALGKNSLRQYGAITGTITTPQRTPVPDGYANAYDADDNEVDYDSTDQGRYRLVVPAGSYAVQLGGEDPKAQRYFLSEFWNNAATLVTATRVAVTPGKTVTGVNAQLTDKLESLRSPSISGTAVVGRALSANTGLWNRMAGNEYKVTWLRGSTPVASGARYVVKPADVGYRLAIRVESTNPGLDQTGTAVSASTAGVKGPSSTVLSARSPRARVVKLAVTVSGVSNPGGTVTFKKGAAKVRTVAVVNGKAVLTLKGQKKGKARFTAAYNGSARALPSTSGVVTVKVK